MREEERNNTRAELRHNSEKGKPDISMVGRNAAPALNKFLLVGKLVEAPFPAPKKVFFDSLRWTEESNNDW